MSIKAIDSASIHRLTSGQVIIDLQTAVKELVENSLDAGATSIEVRFKNFGLTSVEVVDNGHGIREQDYQNIALKHHTSKLCSYSDLATVKTFGFRGEALSSLCSLSSSFTVVTATAEQAPMAAILEFSQDGKLKASLGKTARNRGTAITVSGLFTSLPVRRKEFERNVKREYGKALSILHAYALVPCNKENNGVRLVVTNQQDKGSRSVQLHTDGTSLRASVLSIWGPRSLDNIVPLKLGFTVVVNRSATLKKRGLEPDINIPVEVRGLISQFSVGCGRANTERQFFFVNGRPSSLNKIQKVFNEIYRSFNSGQAPFIIADFRLPTDAYDVNVSPDKRTIFLHDEEALIQAFKESVEETFSSSRSTYNLNHTLPPSISQTKLTQSIPATPPVSSDAVCLLDKNKYSQIVASGNSAVSLPHHSKSVVTNSQTDTSGIILVSDTESYSTSVDVSLDPSDKPPKKRLKIDRSVAPQSVLDTKGASWNLRRFASETQPESIAQSESLRSKRSSGTIPPTATQTSEHSGTIHGEEDIDLPYIQDQGTEVSRLLSKSSDGFRNTKTTNAMPDDYEPDCLSADELNIEASFDSDVHALMSISIPSPEITRTIVSKTDLKLDLRRLQKIWWQLRSDKSACNNTVPGTYDGLKKHASVSNDVEEAEKELTRVIHKEDFGHMQVMGQFNLGFIIARLERSTELDDLFIIDQHASDEKYNFETLQQSTRIKSQKLLQPQTIELTSAEELIAMDNIDVLLDNGFEVIFQEDAARGSGKRIQLVSQPISKDTVFNLDDLAELLYLIRDSQDKRSIRCSKARAMFAMRACRKSVMIGTPLTTKQMISIVRNMGSMDQPWHCPHGRPTMRHLINLQSFDNPRRDISWVKFTSSDYLRCN